MDWLLAASYLLSGALLGLSAVASPGPFQAYLISQTLKTSWRRTMPAAFAPLISDGPIILLVLFGLTQLPDQFLLYIQFAGGLLLLYFAWRTFQAFRRFEFDLAAASAPGSQNLFEAALVNALSPGPWIFWSLMAGPILLEGWRISPAYGSAYLVGFYGTLIIGLGLFILILGTARQFGEKFTRTLLGLSALILFFFGLYQLYKGVSIL
jgi:threonine/homoserine/homoserine lactone efflux protein